MTLDALPSPHPPPRSGFRLIGRALLWGSAWAFLAPVLTLVPMIAIYMSDARCGSPGDSGGCEMGIVSVVLAMVPVGFLLGFSIKLARGLWRVYRARV